MTWEEAQNIVRVLVEEGRDMGELTDHELILFVQACDLLGRMMDNQAG